MLPKTIEGNKTMSWETTLSKIFAIVGNENGLFYAKK
jgi:hypothetical protein